MQEGEAFCVKCGTPMQSQAKEEPVSKTAKPKKKSPVGILIALAVIAVLAAAGVFICLHFFTYRSVKVEDYEGDVELERKGGDKALFEGMKLVPKDVVTTGEDGLIELFIDSDKHVVAEANTCFSINAVGDEDSGKVTIELEYGSTLISIDEKLAQDSEFEVETPNCLCSVRGTIFRVTYGEDRNSTSIEVIEGVVHVKAGDTELDLNAGESLTIRDDILPQVNAEGYVEFGAYEQDANLANGPELIEWEVLDTNEEGILLVSRYVLDGQPYHTEAEDVNWANSSLRQWLNDDFYHAAFTENEREYVRQVTIPNPDNAFWGTPGGGMTHDSVFLLSVEEILKYYPFETWDVGNSPLNGYSSALITAPTEYVKTKIPYATIDQQCYDDLLEEGSGYAADIIGKESTGWWTRSPAITNDEAAPVSCFGFAGWNFSNKVDHADYGVRPALYIPADALDLTDESVAGPDPSGSAVQTVPPAPAPETEITTGHGMGTDGSRPETGGGVAATGTDHVLGPGQSGNNGNNSGNNGGHNDGGAPSGQTQGGGGARPSEVAADPDLYSEIAGHWHMDGAGADEDLYLYEDGTCTYSSRGKDLYGVFTYTYDGTTVTFSLETVIGNQLKHGTSGGAEVLGQGNFGTVCFWRR